MKDSLRRYWPVLAFALLWTAYLVWRNAHPTLQEVYVAAIQVGETAPGSYIVMLRLENHSSRFRLHRAKLALYVQDTPSGLPDPSGGNLLAQTLVDVDADIPPGGSADTRTPASTAPLPRPKGKLAWGWHLVAVE